jgi:hydroxyacylglutathione hydrolase
MIFQNFRTGMLEVNCYILACEVSHKGFVIDPGGDTETIIAFLEQNSIKPKYIILTHGHWDHIGGVRAIKDKYDSSIALHKDDNWLYSQASEVAEIFGFEMETPPPIDEFLQDNASLEAGELQMKVIHTPGHSQGSVCLSVKKMLFTGDLLFAGGVGRTDLPGGDERLLKDSIRNKILILPEDIIVYPGHGKATTIHDEKQNNAFLSLD